MLEVRHETTKPNAPPDVISFHVVHTSDKNSPCLFWGERKKEKENCQIKKCAREVANLC